MLYKLLAVMKDERINSVVISLMMRGSLTKKIESLGVSVHSLDLHQGEKPSWNTMKRLNLLVREFKPDIVQGWMYHGNIAATWAAIYCWIRLMGVSLFWNIRQTLYFMSKEKRQTQILIRISSILSVLPNLNSSDKCITQ